MAVSLSLLDQLATLENIFFDNLDDADVASLDNKFALEFSDLGTYWISKLLKVDARSLIF